MIELGDRLMQARPDLGGQLLQLPPIGGEPLQKVDGVADLREPVLGARRRHGESMSQSR